MVAHKNELGCSFWYKIPPKPNPNRSLYCILSHSLFLKYSNALFISLTHLSSRTLTTMYRIFYGVSYYQKKRGERSRLSIISQSSDTPWVLYQRRKGEKAEEKRSLTKFFVTEEQMPRPGPPLDHMERSNACVLPLVTGISLLPWRINPTLRSPRIDKTHDAR